ncbi:hypothetical protein [Candidatus Ventrimonas sp.]
MRKKIENPSWRDAAHGGKHAGNGGAFEAALRAPGLSFICVILDDGAIRE